MKVKQYLKMTLCLALFSSNASALSNSSAMFVESVESRSSGYHALFGSGVIPDQDCTYRDRAIIVDSDVGSQTMVSIALSALLSGKKVIVQVSGCTIVSPEHGDKTAPKMTKLHIYRS